MSLSGVQGDANYLVPLSAFDVTSLHGFIILSVPFSTALVVLFAQDALWYSSSYVDIFVSVSNELYWFFFNPESDP